MLPAGTRVPDQRLRVQQLPVRPLNALHPRIIPEHRTHCRQIRRSRAPYSEPSRVVGGHPAKCAAR